MNTSVMVTEDAKKAIKDSVEEVFETKFNEKFSDAVVALTGKITIRLGISVIIVVASASALWYTQQLKWQSTDQYTHDRATFVDAKINAIEQEQSKQYDTIINLLQKK